MSHLQPLAAQPDGEANPRRLILIVVGEQFLRRRLDDRIQIRTFVNATSTILPGDVRAGANADQFSEETLGTVWPRQIQKIWNSARRRVCRRPDLSRLGV